MSQRPAIGVGIIITKDEQVLLLKRKYVHGDGSWSTPGGHLEFGESPEECAIREAKEETGVSVTDLKFRAITNDIFERDGMHYITIWMGGRYLSGEPVVNDPHEMAEVGWFTWEVLPKPLFLPLQNLLDGRCYPSRTDQEQRNGR